MSAFLYLFKTTLKNRIKKALKKPVTYLYTVFIVAYAVFILATLGSMAGDFGVATPEGLAGVFTAFAFFFIPANLVSYGKRKGLIFQQSDIHFLFQSPVKPKLVLLNAHVKNIILGILVGIGLVVAGVLWFHIPLWKMLLYFLFSQVIENILEGSMMLIFYGSEKLSETSLKVIRYIMYAAILSFVAFGFYFLSQNGFQVTTAFDYLNHDYLQIVPVIGWNIAAIHLIFVGPTLINVIGTILYGISAVIFLVLAYRMDCQGGFYEDAMKFADDYAEARAKSKKGEVAVLGKKKKFNKANVTYKGYYGKAIFYRQLLEYKKNKFFIFGLNTLVSVGAAVVAYFMSQDAEIATSAYRPFLIPGIMAYMCFIFSGYPTKWGKEMASPYTYLIPDRPIRKLWYATLIEHIRSFLDGAIFAIPAAILLEISVVQMLLSILIYICIQAFKLYSTVMLEALLGKSLGPMAKQIFRMLLMATFIGFGVIAAVLGNMLVSLEVGYLLMILTITVITAAFMVIASTSFEKMESIE